MRRSSDAYIRRELILCFILVVSTTIFVLVGLSRIIFAPESKILQLGIIILSAATGLQLGKKYTPFLAIFIHRYILRNLF
nr:MAG TPA: hypothetical protein [Caudoviricetes sp.]